MALPGWSIDVVVGLARPALDEYFGSFARYDIFAPGKARYAIRVGSKTFRSDDTMDLKNKLLKYLAVERRKRTIAAKVHRPRKSARLRGRGSQS